MKSPSLFIAFLLLSIGSSAQEQPTGIPPFSSIQSIGVEAINRQNLNVNFSIPMVSTPERGGSFGFPIVNDSLLWMKSGGKWVPVVDSGGSPTWGWKTKLPAGMTRYLTISENCDTPPPIQSSVHFFNFSYVDPAGTTHKFGVNFYTVPTICGFPTGPRTGYALDGSGYFLDASSATSPKVTTPAGAIVTGASWTDSNGNFVSATIVNSSETDWKDTAGHTSLKIITSGTTIQYQYPDTSGAYQTATLRLTSTPIKTNFGCSGVIEYTGTANLPTELDLPNNQKYLFTYEPTPSQTGYYTGRVKRVTLPTGGYLEHQYGTTNDGINCSDGSVTNLSVVVSDGTNTSTMQLTRALSGGNWVTTVTAPQLSYDSAANQSTFTFNSAGQEIGEKLYQGSTTGSLLQTVTSTWTPGGFPSTRIAVLEDNLTQNEIETTFDTYGNLLSLKEHDWGSGSPGPVIRTTSYTYLNGSPYVTANIVNRPTRITVADGTGAVKARTDIAYDETGYINSPCISGAVQHNDTIYTCSYTVRGNPTTVTSYTDPVTPAGGIVKHSYYDSLGNVVKADADCCQQISWTYTATTNYAFPDSATSGISSPQLTVSATYNPYTGMLSTSTDENGQSTTYAYADPGHMNRISSVTRPDSSQIAYTYDDVNFVVQINSPLTSSSVVEQKIYYDGLGRKIKQQILDGAGTSSSVVETKYDAWSRPYKVSNAHNSTAQYWTETRTDALGRVLRTLLPDGGQNVVTYSLNTIVLTDPVGNQRKSVADGLGRTITVYEPDVANSNALTQQTSYAYNVLGNLTGVTQGAQTRTFVYDPLGRLTDSTTPEAGHSNFQYNNYNQVNQKTDARGVITTYSYDTLNRLYQTSYNVGSTGVPSTATVTLTYGTNPALFNKGRVSLMTDGAGSESYAYDRFGRITQLTKVIGTNSYVIGYTYNTAGEPIQINYPSGRVVVQNYDSLGRLCSVGTTGSTCTSGTNYASSYNYNPAWQLTGVNYGNGTSLIAAYNPDNLLLQSLQYKNGAQTFFSTNYWYKNDATNCPSAPSAANGQIRCINDLVDSGRSAVYAYDALYRLTGASTKGSTGYPQWGLAFVYDRYGNRSAQNVTAGTGVPSSCVGISSTSNRLTGPCAGGSFTYDANGNMTNDGLNTLVYDAANHLVSSTNGGSSGTYTYDGNGLRVKSVSGATTTTTIFSGSSDLAEYLNGALPSAPTNEYIYSGAQQIAAVQGGTTYYLHNDHLSLRLRTNSSGTVADQRGTYPFGESWYAPSGSPWMFTSYHRDAESGNDYAMARTYVNRYGRFSSPDPLSGQIGDPQSLNRYAYVNNDPCNRVDPLGLSSTCTLNVAFTTGSGAAALSNAEKAAITTQVNALLSATKQPGNNLVQISTSFSGNADYTVNFENKGLLDQLIFDRKGTTYGYADLGGTSATVFMDSIRAVPGKVGKKAMSATMLAGGITAHELVHLSAGVPDLNYKEDNPNAMMYDNAPGDDQLAALSHPNSPLWKFSSAQLSAMYRDCILRHSVTPRAPTARNLGPLNPPDIGNPAGSWVGPIWIWVSGGCVDSAAGHSCVEGEWQVILPF